LQLLVLRDCTVQFTNKCTEVANRIFAGEEHLQARGTKNEAIVFPYNRKMPLACHVVE